MKWMRYKFVWLLGLAVLIGSLLGANHIMNAPRESPQKREGGASANQNRATGVIVPGQVAPENDPIPLAPSAQGEVTEVAVKAPKEVKKGDLLLKIDDRRAKNLLLQAEALIA